MFDKTARIAVKQPRDLMPTQTRRATRGEPLAGKHVTLHLGKRDMTLGKPTIGMKDRIVGILPALVGEPLLRCAQIFHKTVAIRIARTVNPAQSRFNGGP